jgi:hypothetical protein
VCAAQDVHGKIMANIKKRNEGQVQGIIDPLTGEPVIPLEKTPNLAVELALADGGGSSSTSVEVPSHALGTYLLFFGNRCGTLPELRCLAHPPLPPRNDVPRNTCSLSHCVALPLSLPHSLTPSIARALSLSLSLSLSIYLSYSRAFTA